MKKLTKLAVCLALPLSGAVFASVAAASTATATFPVTATVVDSCAVVASALAFGNYNGISGGMLDSTAAITPTCTIGTGYTVALSAGLGSGATQITRKLSGPDGVTLDYGIYTDTARSTVWGDGTGGTGNNNSVGTGIAQSFTMYGRIPAAQAAMVGTYADTITVTLTY